MPRIFDNIEKHLLPSLLQTLKLSQRADFCVGYFNLRGWKMIDEPIGKWQGTDESRCRVMVGMQRVPSDELKEYFSLASKQEEIDNRKALEMKREMGKQFREQLLMGTPSNDDELGLRRLCKQLKSGKVVVKLHLRFSLHAKLYLIHRDDPNNPTLGIVGSSNLTMAGLSGQGELNVDVLDHDACTKLQKWFNDRWEDRWCVDISKELADIIDESWAREELISPYHIYLKMAYHLSQEAREGLAEFKIPKRFRDILFEFQSAAVRIAAHHVRKRGGVLIGDVVGLGKTMVGAALARIFQEDDDASTLILCPKNLVGMWSGYKDNYELNVSIIPFSRVLRELSELRRYKYVIIDESHNLRNRESRTYRAIQEYIYHNEANVVLLTATPYNKTYLDLSSQLRLFVNEGQDIGIRPEQLIDEVGEVEFQRRYQCGLRSLAAFEKSDYPDDWRELMRLFMVRRTRSFITENYALLDDTNNRKYLPFHDGRRSYFPVRKPSTVKFQVSTEAKNDQYARLFSEQVVDLINGLHLPRYGLGNYIKPMPNAKLSSKDQTALSNLSRAGKRLMGFCRTNLFKRLESSGYAFLLSVERHILRNFIFMHALENGLDLPIGTQDQVVFNSHLVDQDDSVLPDWENAEYSQQELDFVSKEVPEAMIDNESLLKQKAAETYQEYKKKLGKRFEWLSSSYFDESLKEHLYSDAKDMMRILQLSGAWQPKLDKKLIELQALVQDIHPEEKVLLFSQFADTVTYLYRQLKPSLGDNLAAVTGDTEDPTKLAQRFSPVSNDKRKAINPEDEIRVLLTTDILSEGQNLQDGYIIVNYDLPWAIIRLIQRAGRVDRIGQKSDTIHCYTFLPADGVERIIGLRQRVRERLHQNAEVVGTDEAFFDDDRNNAVITDLYHEKAGILDGDEDDEVDLASRAWQIWHNAVKDKPKLEKAVTELPEVVFSTKQHTGQTPGGTLVYVRTAEGSDALAWVDETGKSFSESQLAILKAAECAPDTPALPRTENHHELVKSGVEQIIREEKQIGGALGSPKGIRFRLYERLQDYAKEMRDTVFDSPQLHRVIDEIYRNPLLENARDNLGRLLRSGASNQELVDRALGLFEDDRLCNKDEKTYSQEPRIICSLGLKK